MKKPATDPPRLPRSIKAKVEKPAASDGTSTTRFVAAAGVAKRAAMNAAAFFAERRARADVKVFDRLMRRKGGDPPQPDDTLS